MMTKMENPQLLSSTDNTVLSQLALRFKEYCNMEIENIFIYYQKSKNTTFILNKRSRSMLAVSILNYQELIKIMVTKYGVIPIYETYLRYDKIGINNCVGIRISQFKKASNETVENYNYDTLFGKDLILNYFNSLVKEDNPFTDYFDYVLLNYWKITQKDLYHNNLAMSSFESLVNRYSLEEKGNYTLNELYVFNRITGEYGSATNIIETLNEDKNILDHNSFNVKLIKNSKDLLNKKVSLKSKIWDTKDTVFSHNPEDLLVAITPLKYLE